MMTQTCPQYGWQCNCEKVGPDYNCRFEEDTGDQFDDEPSDPHKELEKAQTGTVELNYPEPE